MEERDHNIFTLQQGRRAKVSREEEIFKVLGFLSLFVAFKVLQLILPSVWLLVQSSALGQVLYCTCQLKQH